LILVVVFLRFWGLGDKPLHHDESLFAYYGYNLSQGLGYIYMPIMHGPVLQFASAFFFVLFGDSDFVMRLPAAVGGGLGLVWAFWAWRRELARAAGLSSAEHPSWLPWVPVGVALGFLALSPSIGYYSRFLRNDAPYLAATVACALFALRAFRDRSPRDLFAAILFAALMFSMMESSIFFFVACLGYLGAVFMLEWVRGVGDGSEASTAKVGSSSSQDPTAAWVAALIALPVAAEIMLRLPLNWPPRTGFILAFGGLAAVHLWFLGLASQSGSLCWDILKLAKRLHGWLVAGFSVIGLLIVLQHVLTPQATPMLWTIAGYSSIGSFLLVSFSAFMGGAALVQTVGLWLQPRAAKALGNPGENRTGQVDTGSPAQPSVPPSQLFQAIWMAGLGSALLGWLYWRILSETVHVGKLFELPLRALGWENTQELGLALAFATLTLVLFHISLTFLKALERPGNSAVGRFAVTVYKSRKMILLGIILSVFFYQAIFTTLFTHTVDKTFNHQLRDWSEPTAPLTPVQIYKNTWDYWWDQHREHRIKGPFHYYLPILSLYEWPAMIFVLAWGAAFVFRRTPRRWARLLFLGAPHVVLAAFVTDVAPVIPWVWLDDHVHVSHPIHLHLVLFYLQTQFVISPLLWRAGRRVESFLLFWMITQLFAYSYAGEKVPWLTIHTAAPMILLAGVAAGRWLASWQRLAPNARTWRLRAAVGLAILLGSWQLKSYVMANFLWPSSPRERIVFNHTSTDVDWAMKEIDRVRMITGQGHQLSMFIAGEMGWPLYWYLRRTPEAFNKGDDPLETTRRPIVICDWHGVLGNRNLTENYRIVRLKVREWWEPAMLDWRVLADIHLALTARESRQVEGPGQALALRLQSSQREWIKLGRHLLFREIFLDPDNPEYSNTGNEFCLAIRKDLEPGPRPEYIGEAPFRREIPVVR
jgi:uncharacterized protein (TIGR03663 family)